MTYIDTAITQVYQTYEKYDFKKYYKRMQKLLADRHVTIVCGDGVFDKLQYKAYDVCKSVEFVTAPSMNAFAEYDRLLHDVLKINKKTTGVHCARANRESACLRFAQKGISSMGYGALLQGLRCIHEEKAKDSGGDCAVLQAGLKEMPNNPVYD